jgi:hypothetical protein
MVSAKKRTRTVAALMIAAVLASCAAAGSAPFAGGKDPNLWDKHFVLTHDLDMKRIDPNAFQPIGDSEGNPFSGVFDGRGRTIANLSIVRRTAPWVGVFGQIGQAFMEDVPPGHVRNLHLRSISVVGKDAVGALAGELSVGTIKNCSVTGIVTGKTMVGGLVGWGHGEVVSCTASVEVHGEEIVGGLIGDMSGTVIHCLTSGAVRGRTRVGGGRSDSGLLCPRSGRRDDTGRGPHRHDGGLLHQSVLLSRSRQGRRARRRPHRQE